MRGAGTTTTIPGGQKGTWREPCPQTSPQPRGLMTSQKPRSHPDFFRCRKKADGQRKASPTHEYDLSGRHDCCRVQTNQLKSCLNRGTPCLASFSASPRSPRYLPSHKFAIGTSWVPCHFSFVSGVDGAVRIATRLIATAYDTWKFHPVDAKSTRARGDRKLSNVLTVEYLEPCYSSGPKTSACAELLADALSVCSFSELAQSCRLWRRGRSAA